MQQLADMIRALHVCEQALRRGDLSYMNYWRLTRWLIDGINVTPPL